MLRLLARPKWLALLALLVAYVLVCLSLGAWQWNRREEAQAAIARLDANWAAPARPVAEVLPEYDAYEVPQQWARVELVGRYDPAGEAYVRGRVVDGQVGFKQVVPFITETGDVFYVDRGFVPVATDGSEGPAVRPAIPTGQVHLLARLRQNEGPIKAADAPAGQLYSVDLPALVEARPEPGYTGAYGLLESENGQVPGDLRVQERPVLDEGPHLSYALQWVVFALIGVIGYAYTLREEYRAEAGLERRRKGVTVDELEEDALLGYAAPASRARSPRQIAAERQRQREEDFFADEANWLTPEEVAAIEAEVRGR